MSTSTQTPNAEFEIKLSKDFDLVIGIDEVGRGAIAGPVMVGVAGRAQSNWEDGFPPGLNDSKKLSKKRREQIYQRLETGFTHLATGASSAAEIDQYGIMPAQALAACRALSKINTSANCAVILDGNSDWLGRFLTSRGAEFGFDFASRFTIFPLVKADASSVAVAAASVLAKVERDAQMAELSLGFPHYGWESNVGYGASAHYEAIREYGLCEQHRQSWNLGTTISSNE